MINMSRNGGGAVCTVYVCLYDIIHVRRHPVEVRYTPHNLLIRNSTPAAPKLSVLSAIRSIGW